MNETNTNIEQIFTSSLTAWGAITFSQVMLLVLIYVIKPELLAFDTGKLFAGENAVIVIGLAFAAVVLVAVSFFVKRHFYAIAMAMRKPGQLMTGTLVAVAVCEGASMLGLLTVFVFDNPYFFLWIGLGLFGSLLHFPQRSAFYDAAGTSGGSGDMG